MKVGKVGQKLNVGHKTCNNPAAKRPRICGPKGRLMRVYYKLQAQFVGTNVHQNLVLLELVIVEKKLYQHRKDFIVAFLKTLLVQKMLERK